MVDTNSIGRSMNGRTSNQKGCKNMIESDSVRSSLGLRQSHSSESANSEETCGSTDRLKVQFDAAVQLIQNLPSDGAFQPSDRVKLQFYALYKQATNGPNRSPRPAFYDLVAKYKWDAWTSLGDLSKEEAMQQYIDELVKSIKDTPKVPGDHSELEDKLAPYLNVILNASAKDAESDQTKTQPSDEDASASNDYDDTDTESEEFSDAHDPLSEQSHSEQQPGEDGSKMDMICARGESGLVPTRVIIHNSSSTGNLPFYPNFVGGNARANVPSNRTLAGGSGRDGREGPNRRVPNDTADSISYAILNLQRQVDTILCRVNSVESKLNQSLILPRKNFPKWWPLDISPSTTFLLVCWPFIAQYLMNRIKKRMK